MINESFNPKYFTLTPDGVLNFIGAVERYFDNYTAEFEHETINTYIRDYNERVFPLISAGMPIEAYDENYIEELLDTIKTQNQYNDATINSRYRHLLTDPINAYYNDLSNTANNPLWGAAYKFSTDDSPDDLSTAFAKMPKSLPLDLEMKAADILLDPASDNGARIGLAIMLCTGVRNNEAAGFNFADMLEFLDHPGYYTLRLTRTSVQDSNLRKAGGKTANAPRRLPLIRRFSDFLFARMEYLCSKIEFPFIRNGLTFSSVEDLPIACRGSDYSIPCGASDLTRAGRIFLRDDLKLREQTVSEISYILQHSDYDYSEKDPTTYLLRRNWATHLYTLGFPTEWSQYYMGHLIEDDVLKRSDFNDEGSLFEMEKRLELHPLNNRVFKPERVVIPASVSLHRYIDIENRELNDPVSVTISCPGGKAVIICTTSHREPAREVDITRFLGS